MNVFFGASTSDVNKFIDDIDSDQLSAVDYIEEAVKPLFIPEDPASLINALSNAYSEKDDGYRYRFTYESGKLVQSITDFAGDFIAENLEKGNFDQESLPVRVYNEYLETIKSLFTVGDLTVNASADRNGLLKSTDTVFSVDFSVRDEVIKDAFVKLGLATAEEVQEVLTAFHAFVRAPGGADGLTEFKLMFELSESYVYDVTLDESDPIFASVDTVVPQRTVLKYEQVNENDYYEWNLYGGDFGKKE